MARLTRIEALLGVTIPEVDEAALERLVAGAAREEQDLEYKRELYGNTDKEKKDLAGDVAALANTVGGLLILGIQENNGAAAGLMPVQLSDQEEVRIRQVVASLVVPYPQVTVHRILSSTAQDQGYYLIEVPRSPLAPHAVRVNNEALRYPKRNGSSIRWLAESEIADAYRNRFTMAQQQVERLEVIRREGESALPSLGESAWLSLALAPNQPGQMPLTRKIVQRSSEFLCSVPIPGLGGSIFPSSSMTPRAGFRRVEVLSGQDNEGNPRDSVLHLHTDGGGFVGSLVGREWRDSTGLQRGGVVHVPDVYLMQEVMNAVGILAHHAVNQCGTYGEAVIEVTLLAGMPMQLGQAFGHVLGDIWGHQIKAAPVGRRTINLDEIASSGKGLAIAAHLVLNDLIQGFGFPEVPQLTADGAIRIRYFPREYHDHIRNVVKHSDLEITTDTL